MSEDTIGKEMEKEEKDIPGQKTVDGVDTRIMVKIGGVTTNGSMVGKEEATGDIEIIEASREDSVCIHLRKRET